MRLPLPLRFALLCLPLALLGCALEQTAAPVASTGLALQGSVFGGQQPINGSHVYLLAANTTGYGGDGIPPSTSNASISLLSGTGLSDSLGSYVLSNVRGGFSITGDYACTPNTQVYLYAFGGDSGSGTNSASSLMAVLGNCPSSGTFLATIPRIQVNEVTTIAAAYGLAGFATDSTHISSSGTALAQTGIANAFANASNLASIVSGATINSTPGMVVPQAEINTLANVLAACINSVGSASFACSTLFNNTPSGDATPTLPTNTASAAINLAHKPAANTGILFGLPTTSAPFAPALRSQPLDFSIILTFTGGSLNITFGIAIDAQGNVWASNQDSGLTKFSSAGVLLSGTNGYADGNQRGTVGVAIDPYGDVWQTNSFSNSVSKFSNSGQVLSGTNGFTGAYISAPSAVGIDAQGDAWIGNQGTNTLVKLSNAGTLLSPTGGYTGGNIAYPLNIQFDGAGNAWIANYASSSITKLSSSGSVLSGQNGYSGTGISTPRAIAIDSAGSVWVASSSASVSQPGGLSKFSNAGAVLLSQNGNSAGNNGLDYESVAIDGAGDAWVSSQFPSSGLVEYSTAGTLLTSQTGYQSSINVPTGIAVDGSGNVWVADENGAVDELVGAAAPVITPIVAGLPSTPTADGSSRLGTRP